VPTARSLAALFIVGLALLAVPGAFAALQPIPAFGLPVYAGFPPDLLESFGAQPQAADAQTQPAPAAAEEPLGPESPAASQAAPQKDADEPTATPRSARTPWPPRRGVLGRSWPRSLDFSSLRARLLRDKRAEYGYPPEGPDGSEPALNDEGRTEDPEDGALEGLTPDVPRHRSEGPGWRYRHRAHGGLRALPEDIEELSEPDVRDLGPRGLRHPESLRYNGPWPWETEAEEFDDTQDGGQMQLRYRPADPTPRLVTLRCHGPR